MKHLFFFLCIAFSSWSISSLEAQTESQLEQFDQRLTALEKQTKQYPIYNSSARPLVAEGYNVYLTGSGLWWKAQENGLEYAVKTNDPNLDQLNDKFQIKTPQFTYDIGFRIGLGYNIPHDSWDLYVNWTRFRTEDKGHTHTTGTSGLLPVWSTFLVANQFPFAKAHAHWEIELNMIDGEVGREYAIGKWVTLRPSIGLETVWIKQHYNIHYENFFSPTVSEDKIRLVNDYSGIGPKASLDTEWSLFWGFSLYGSGMLSLLYGDFEVRLHEHLEAVVSQKNRFHHDYHLVRALADLEFGLAWDVMFAHDKFHFGLRLGWEQMLFWGQNQLFRLANAEFAGSLISNLGDLSFQGATLSARIDF